MTEQYQPLEMLPKFEIANFDPLQLEQLARHYQTERFVPIPDLISPEQAHDLLMSTKDTASRRVICGDEHNAWDEQTFGPDHPAHQFFAQEKTAALVTALVGLDKIREIVTWTSGYGTGEYINPHTDGAGSVQLLVCLQAPESEQQGGKLIVGGHELFLTPGMAVVFEATSLEHYTTPFVATKTDPNPRRVVLVGRYFLN